MRKNHRIFRQIPTKLWRIISQVWRIVIFYLSTNSCSPKANIAWNFSPILQICKGRKIGKNSNRVRALWYAPDFFYIFHLFDQ